MTFQLERLAVYLHKCHITRKIAKHFKNFSDLTTKQRKTNQSEDGGGNGQGLFEIPLGIVVHKGGECRPLLPIELESMKFLRCRSIQFVRVLMIF